MAIFRNLLPNQVFCQKLTKLLTVSASGNPPLFLQFSTAEPRLTCFNIFPNHCLRLKWMGLTRYFLPDGPGHVMPPRPFVPLLVTDVRHHTKKTLSCQELPGIARSCQELPGAARICQELPGIARRCQELPELPRICQELPGVARICQDLPASAMTCQELPGFAKSCQELPGIARSCQELPESATARSCQELPGADRSCLPNFPLFSC